MPVVRADLGPNGVPLLENPASASPVLNPPSQDRLLQAAQEGERREGSLPGMLKAWGAVGPAEGASLRQDKGDSRGMWKAGEAVGRLPGHGIPWPGDGCHRRRS